MLSRLFAIVALLALNAFFVAVEFALVRARRSRLEAMVRAGDHFARFAVTATSRTSLTRVLSAGQLGITLASLGLGWVAEGTIGHALEVWFVSLPIAVEMSVRVGLAAAIDGEEASSLGHHGRQVETAMAALRAFDPSSGTPDERLALVK